LSFNQPVSRFQRNKERKNEQVGRIDVSYYIDYYVKQLQLGKPDGGIYALNREQRTIQWMCIGHHLDYPI
jgi:hypothetical protein